MYHLHICVVRLGSHQRNLQKLKTNKFLPRDAVLSAAYVSVFQSVRPSVCLSHSSIVSKRLNVSSKCSLFVTPQLWYFFRTQRFRDIPTGSPLIRASNGTLVSFDRSHTSSYSSSIVTMAISCIVCEIKQHQYWSKMPTFNTPYHLTCTIIQNPLSFVKN